MLKEICLAGLEEASASVVDLGLMHFMGSRGKENRKTWPGHCLVVLVDSYPDTCSHLWGGDARQGMA